MTMFCSIFFVALLVIAGNYNPVHAFLPKVTTSSQSKFNHNIRSTVLMKNTKIFSAHTRNLRHAMIMSTGDDLSMPEPINPATESQLTAVAKDIPSNVINYQYSTVSSQFIIITSIAISVYEYMQSPYRSVSILLQQVQSTLPVVSSMVTSTVISNLLMSASLRSRLDASTFKTLNLGFLLSSILYYLVNIAYRKVVISDISFVSFYTLNLILQLSYAAFSALPAYRSIQYFGLPVVKIEPLKQVADANGLPLITFISLIASCMVYFSNILARGLFTYFETSSIGHVFASLVPASVFSVSTFLIPSMLLALHSASLAGAKRLSSDTYQILSKTIIFFSGINLLSLFSDMVIPLVTGGSSGTLVTSGINMKLLKNIGCGATYILSMISSYMTWRVGHKYVVNSVSKQ